MAKNKNFTVCFFLFLLLFLTVYISLLSGPVKIPFGNFKLNSLNENPIAKIRIYRILLAIIAGAGLSVSGTIFQGLLRNPLADPYLLGVSSGAGFAAVMSLTLGIGSLSFGFQLLPVAAFLGGLITVFLVYNLAKIGQKVPVQTLLLSGVVIGAVFSSLMMFLVSVSRNNQIHSIIWWLLGSLEIIDSSQLLGIGITVIIGTLAGIFYSKELNILSLGDNSAVNLGVNAEFFKKIFFILASFLAASTVAVCGIVGFVGLIIPHIMRLIVGPDHRILIPASALSGAIFLTACDILARNIISPAELPIGVITALCGGPFFIFLLRKKRKMFF